MNEFLYRGIITHEEILSRNFLDENFIDFFEKTCYKVIDLVLEKYDYYQYSSIAVACSCVAVVRKLFNFNVWSKHLE